MTTFMQRRPDKYYPDADAVERRTHRAPTCAEEAEMLRESRRRMDEAEQARYDAALKRYQQG